MSSNPPPLNPKVMEAWFTLWAEAMRGAQQAQDAWDAWAKLTGAPEDLQRWMRDYMPKAAEAMTSPEQFEAWVAEWQRMAGVVPRSQYLEALAKNAELERKLKAAEATIESLRALLAAQGSGAEGAKQVADAWNKLMDETLRTQSEWLRAWTGQTDTGAHEDEPAAESDERESDQ